jgi:hypothetical protein
MKWTQLFRPCLKCNLSWVIFEDCEAVPIIDNGQISLTQDGNTTYGAIANVSCSTGYNATVDTILCLETGKWDNATCNSIGKLIHLYVKETLTYVKT